MIRVKTYIELHLIIFLYAIGGIFSKRAAEETFLSWNYMFNYGMVFFLLAIYAILWQKILKKMPLTVAMANKAITVIWGLLIGAIVFREQITVWNVVGAFVIMLGIIVVVDSDKENTLCT